MKPLVSVIMGVHNTKTEYLRKALESVLRQTYDNLELIVIDDASDAECADFLEIFREEQSRKFDDRMRIYRNSSNKGLTVSLNIALEKASGVYIARMDSDDVCAPDRIMRQVSYMEHHRDIAVLACGAYIYDGTGNAEFAGIYRKFEQERMRIRLSLANIEFTHPAVMFRREFLHRHGLRYDETIRKAQDYNMWVRCIEKESWIPLQEALFVSRIHDDRIGSNAGEQREWADITKVRCLKKLLPHSTERQEYLYAHMRDVELAGSVQENVELVRALIAANDKKRLYDPHIYRQEIFFWWLRKGLYPVNGRGGKRILQDSYMRRNIVYILIPQMCRYMLDKLHGRYVKYRWKKKVVTEDWEQWM